MSRSKDTISALVVNIDRPNGVYRPGEVVQGNVFMEVKEEVKVRGELYVLMLHRVSQKHFRQTRQPSNPVFPIF